MTDTAPTNKTKDIVSGIAVTFVTLLAATHVPILGFLGSLLIPLPVMYYRIKLGRDAAMLIPLSVMAAVFILFGSISVDAVYFIQMLLLGFVIGEVLERDLPFERVFIYAWGTLLLPAVVILLFYSAISDIGIPTLISNYVGRNLEMVLPLYKNLGLLEEGMNLSTPSVSAYHRLLVQIFPALVAMFTFFLVWLNVQLSRTLLTIRNLACPQFGSLNRWQAPDTLVWAVIGCGVGLLQPVHWLSVIAQNGFLMLMMIYFFQGIAIVSFYFEKKQFPRFARILIYGFILIQQLATLIIIALGFFDIWLNFRKLEKELHK